MVRSNLYDAETQRDLLKAQLAELNGSSEEQRVQVAKDQEVKSMGILIEKRNSAEQKAALLAVSLLEGRADTLRLETNASLMVHSLSTIEREIADMHLETTRLSDEAERHRKHSADKKDALDQCKLSCSKYDEENSALRSEVQVLQGAVQEKKNTIRDIFVKYAQSELMKKFFDSAPSSVSLHEAGHDGAAGESALELEVLLRVEMKSLRDKMRILLGEESLRSLEMDEGKDQYHHHDKHLAATRSVCLRCRM